MHGAFTYCDERLANFDVAAVVEVIEHFDSARLKAFEHARPRTIVLTMPSREYNVTWKSLPSDQMRHGNHRFEWTRAEFQDWAKGAADRFGYSVRYLPVGPEKADVGAPSKTALF